MKMLLTEKKGRMLAGVHSSHFVLAVGHNSIATWFFYPDNPKKKFIAVYTASETYEIDSKSGINDAQAVFYYMTNNEKYLKQWTGALCNNKKKAIMNAEEAISIIENSGDFLKFSVYTKGKEKYGL